MGYWAKRSGGHIGKDGQLTVKGKRGSNTGGRNNNGDNVKRSIASLLVQHAAGYGFYNGVRIKK
jgi:hypothetical protein